MANNLAAMEKLFKATPHPLLPWPFTAQDLWSADEATLLEIATLYADREKRIALARDSDHGGDPFNYGWLLWHWKEVDEAMALKIIFIILLGGNRSAKSECCARKTVEALMFHPNVKIICGAETVASSIETQQALIWKYLPNHIKALNGKRDPNKKYKVNYSLANGFTDGSLIVPVNDPATGKLLGYSKMFFKTFVMEPAKALEGQQFGHAEHLTVGAWMDEDMPYNWMEALDRRLRFQPAHLLWSFTPIYGITPTIKNVVGAAPRTLKSLKAELLPQERVLVPGCPPGQMPFVQETEMTRGRVIYFFTEFNPFSAGDRTFYESVKEVCAGKTEDYIKRIAYGYTEDTRSKLFYAYGIHNLVDPQDVPAEGTNYMFTDPAGNRNWATVWVRVVPGKPRRIYFYRDWPDEKRFGSWAEMDVNGKHPDGTEGPAQRPTVQGYLGYKKTWLREERALAPAALMLAQTMGDKTAAMEAIADIKDPYHRWLFTRQPGEKEIQERIHERYIDPRAGKDQKIAEKGSTCIIYEMEKPSRDEKTGELLAPGFFFLPAKGLNKESQWTEVNNLLALPKPTEPVCRVMNEPQLYVSRACSQVIWALNNYTWTEPEGAGEDFADLLGYVATADLRHVLTREERGKVETWGY